MTSPQHDNSSGDIFKLILIVLLFLIFRPEIIAGIILFAFFGVVIFVLFGLFFGGCGGGNDELDGSGFTGNPSIFDEYHDN